MLGTQATRAPPEALDYTLLPQAKIKQKKKTKKTWTLSSPSS